MSPRKSTVERVLAGTVIFPCLLFSLAANAAPPSTSDVERLIRRGNELRSAGRDQQALPLYQEAFDLAPTPRTVAQLGLCEMALGYWLAADTHLSEALAGRSEWIDRNRSTIETSLRQVKEQIGELLVTGSPVGASVSVNGRKVGVLPLAPVRAVAGQVRVEVSASGYQDRIESIALVGRNQARLTINLQRAGVADELRPAQIARRTPITEMDSRSRSPAAKGSSGWGTGKIAGFILVGVGVAAIATGAFSLRSATEDCSAPAGAVCNKGPKSKVPGWTLIGAGTALSIGGGVMVFSSGDGQGPVSHAFVVSLRGSLW